LVSKCFEILQPTNNRTDTKYEFVSYECNTWWQIFHHYKLPCIITDYVEREVFLTCNSCISTIPHPFCRCKALDSTADGYVRAEACAIIIIGDPELDTSLAILSGTAVNQDGRCNDLHRHLYPVPSIFILDGMIMSLILHVNTIIWVSD